jgi:general secretion pathway protein E
LPWPEPRTSHKLSIEEVLQDLVSDGLVVKSAAQNLLLTVTAKQRAERHALEIVADAQLHPAKSPKRVITLEELTF